MAFIPPSNKDQFSWILCLSLWKEDNINAQLASIHDVFEDEKLSSFQSSNTAFIGLKKFAEDNWQWSDGTKANFTDWEEGQPRDGECAVMHKNGNWW